MKEPCRSLVRIAVAGHTTVGKTTLISTLTKSDAGKIGNRGNTTKKQNNFEPKDHESIQAIFTDCPGFQNAGLMSQLFNFQNMSPELTEAFMKSIQLENVDLKYDQIACEALRNSDIVLYIGDLQIPADDSHIQEIRLVKKIQPNIIAVLNKGITLERIKGEKEKLSRIKQWSSKLRECSVRSIIDFDSHWDKPFKVEDIYSAILEMLPSNKKIYSRLA